MMVINGMINFGKINSLRVIGIDKFDITLDGGELGEIILAKKEIHGRCQVNDNVDVFLYRDSKGELILSTRRPYAQAGQFALLKVVSSNSYGAFLDWGLEQDIRVSVKEQQKRMRQGQSYIVHVYNDKNNRIVASSRLTKFLKNLPSDFREGQRVDLVIGDITPMGYRAIINGTHLGVLYKNEVFQLLKKGQAVKGFIKNIREDGKIDLALQKRSAKEKDELSKKIVDVLNERGGSLNISDKTSPERIYNLFGVSKKRYKNSIGALYKKRIITVEDHSIKLVNEQRQKQLKELTGEHGQKGRRIVKRGINKSGPKK